MSSKSKFILDVSDDMKRDFQFSDVLVVCENILTAEENENLRKIENHGEKIDQFLLYLSRKPLEDLSVFLTYLEEWYHWIHKKLLRKINVFKNEDPVLKIHTRGGIPNLPPKNVTRTQILSRVEIELKKLCKGHYLVLHGMVGSGKTSLGVEALNNYDLVMKSFKEQVYWLTVGHEGANDPLFLLTELNTRLPEPLPILSNHPKLASIELAKRFDQKGWTDCLIVLDDVTDKAVLDIFEIGTKFLITTKDTKVISQQRKDKTVFIEVNDGFTLEETMKLFANYLKVPESSLPSYVSEIHKNTKGHPFSLSLIVSHFAEEYQQDLLKNSDRWQYIIDSVRNRRWFRRRNVSFKMCGITVKKKLRRSLSDLELYIKPIELSVDSLQLEEKEYFHKLAVFLEDVNIKPERNLDNKKKTGAAGGPDCRLNDIDTLVCEIIGFGSPALEGLPSSETWTGPKESAAESSEAPATPKTPRHLVTPRIRSLVTGSRRVATLGVVEGGEYPPQMLSRGSA